MPDGSATARAIDYSLKRWAALTRYLDDGDQTLTAETQALSVQAAAAGYDGLAYHSAQRHGGICFAFFEPVLPGIRTRSRQRLIEAETGNLHRLVVTVACGAGLPLV